MYKNCPCGTVGVKIGYALGLLVHGNVVVEFGRKIFLVHCLLWTTFNMAKTRITERAQACSFTQTLQCNHSRIPNCDEVSKWRHSVGSSSYPCQSRYDIDIACHAACTKQRAKTQMACKKSGFKSYQPIETQGSCIAAVTKSQEAHACYSSDVCGHSTKRHILSMSTYVTLL